MTNQEFFTKSVTHVMNQTEQCTSDEDACVYAGPEGAACAVGICMPRELAEKADALNDSDIYTVLKELPAVAELFKGVSAGLMRACQIAHDNISLRSEETLGVLRNEFEKIAKTYGLEMPNV